jgi:hypothetical protein
MKLDNLKAPIQAHVVEEIPTMSNFSLLILSIVFLKPIFAPSITEISVYPFFLK